jgi:hypothetical protein
MEFEAGPGFELAAYDPCPDCGVRDVDMRDPETLMPRRPPPIEWVGWSCLSCEAKGFAEKELRAGYGEEIPPGVRVRGRPYQPPSSDDDEADDLVS